MKAVQASHIVKSYGERLAVNDLSFSVESGEIFGLIGPNGAGKTTTIRMMMDIIRPDSGEITVLSQKLSEEIKDEIGYMPEERGLYRKSKVIDCIVYLASLKGMDRRSAEKRAIELLDRTGMLPNKSKKIEELSKGMSQLIQFIVTTIHDPKLLILDEPFTGLDPVNSDMLKDLLSDLRSEGKAIILSTHGMNDVEQLCDRMLMINKGRQVLYGNIRDIKSRFRSNAVIVESPGEIPEVPGVKEMNFHQGEVELGLDGTATPQQILEQLVSLGTVISRFEIATPSLTDIFIEVAGESND